MSGRPSVHAPATEDCWNGATTCEAASAPSPTFSIAANLLLIPRLGIDGAAVASSCTYTTVLVVVLADYCQRTGALLAEILRLKKGDLRALFRSPDSELGVA